MPGIFLLFLNVRQDLLGNTVTIDRGRKATVDGNLPQDRRGSWSYAGLFWRQQGGSFSLAKFCEGISYPALDGRLFIVATETAFAVAQAVAPSAANKSELGSVSFRSHRGHTEWGWAIPQIRRGETRIEQSSCTQAGNP